MNYKLSFIALFLSFSLYVNAQSGLIASYPFNGNANNESGSQHNGTPFGVTSTTDRFNNNNSAYNFNGNSYIDLGSQIMSRGINDFTYSVWVKTSYSGHINTILSKRHEAEESWYTLTIENNRPQIMLDGPNWFSLINSDRTINDNKWHFIVATKENSTYKLYVDGVLEAEKYESRAVSAFESSLHVGHHGAWNNYFNGSIDDLKIYDKALSLTEIKSLFRNAKSTIITNKDVAQNEKPQTDSFEKTKSMSTSYSYTNTAKIEKTKSKVSKSKSVPVYKGDVEYRNVGGIKCYEFLNPGFFENGQLIKLTNAKIDEWISQIKELKKIQSYYLTWGGKIGGTETKLNAKELLNVNYIGVPIYKTLDYTPAEYVVSEDRNDNYYTISRLVLFPENQQMQFQYTNLYDIDFFHYAFPNASQEKVNNLIATGRSNGILKQNLTWSINKLTKLYPNSTYIKNREIAKNKPKTNQKEFKNYTAGIYTLCNKNYQKDLVLLPFNENNYFTLIDGEQIIDKIVIENNGRQSIFKIIDDSDFKLVQNDDYKRFFTGNCKENNNILKFQIVEYKEENYFLFIVQNPNNTCNTIYLGSEDRNNKNSINPFQHFIEEDKYKATEFLIDNMMGFFRPATNYGPSSSSSSSDNSSISSCAYEEKEDEEKTICNTKVTVRQIKCKGTYYRYLFWAEKSDTYLKCLKYNFDEDNERGWFEFRSNIIDANDGYFLTKSSSFEKAARISCGCESK